MDFGDPIYHRQPQSNPSATISETTPFQNIQISPQNSSNMFQDSSVLHDRSSSGVMPSNEGEELDTSTRPRLTQEQVTILEEEFSKLPKPNTDFKKELAGRIGLTLARVNNWYQNRRAKTKNGLRSTEAHFEVRPEKLQNHLVGFDPSFQEFIDASMFEATQLLSPDSLSGPTEDARKLGYFAEGEDLFPYNVNCYPTELNFENSFGSEASGLLPSDNISLGAAQRYPSLTLPTGDAKTSLPDLIEFDWDSYSSENVAGIAMPEDIPVEHSPRPMYQMSGNGYPLRNTLSSAFMSATSSSDGEQQCLTTPSDRPSPNIFRPQEATERRDSITGALTSNFQNTFHLQSQRSNQALRDNQFDAMDPHLGHSGRVSPNASKKYISNNSPPQASPQELSVPSLANRIDLAARRKRPRPAPLIKPDAQRSHSYNGPLTTSPQSRKMFLDPLHPVRRVRSGLEVAHGRIQKPASDHTRLSPRRLEAQFDHRSTSRDSSQAFAQAPPTPLSATQPARCSPDFPSQPTQEEQVSQQGKSAVWENTFDFHSPPITPYSVTQCSAEQRLPNCYSNTISSHEPPQSAPPQKTSFFFNESPPIPNSNLPHLSWQAPIEVHSNGFLGPSPIAVPQTNYNPISAHFDQPQMQLAYNPAQYQLPPQQRTMYHGPPPQTFQSPQEHFFNGPPQYPFPGQLGHYQHDLFDGQPQSQPLEIKVELGPSPKGTPQPRKQYTFSNSTPKDFTPPKD